MSILLKTGIRRRQLLRGMLGGGAITVALPFLDCFLNDSGTALASGAPLPTRFGMWTWGIGFQPGYGVNEKADTIELLMEAKALEPFKKDMNYFSGFNTPLDGRVNQVHYSGLIAARSGTAPSTTSDIPAPTLDVLVSDAIGGETRFRSLELATYGRTSYSGRNTGAQNAAEESALAFYTKIFGPEFVDPNKAEFKPNPNVMVRQSVLSSVNEDAKRFAKMFGASDRQRMDEYFTSIRETERQLAMQLEKPPPNEACRVPAKPENIAAASSDMNSVLANNKLLANILAMAMACNQTRVFTMNFSRPISDLRKAGEAMSHHQLTHEEPVDAKLGYQPLVAWFNTQSMIGCADWVNAFASIKEGDGTLLDNSLLFAHADLTDARTHSVDGLPMMTFGKAGGKVKTGQMIKGGGSPLTRVGLTAMHVMGVQAGSWGTKSLQTSKPIGEILA